LKININFSAGLFLGEGMWKVLLFCMLSTIYLKIKYDKTFSDFADKSPGQSPTMYSSRLKKVAGC